MFDADKSGDISPEDLQKFYAKCKEYKGIATKGTGQVAALDPSEIANLVQSFDFHKHKAITPDQFLNMVMADYE